MPWGRGTGGDVACGRSGRRLDDLARTGPGSPSGRSGRRLNAVRRVSVALRQAVDISWLNPHALGEV
eukprot:m.177290 g.177290  ORF g.177290 m.177290 type:complete len:67 (-) comp14318_c0_seq1:321-521(-)